MGYAEPIEVVCPKCRKTLQVVPGQNAARHVVTADAPCRECRQADSHTDDRLPLHILHGPPSVETRLERAIEALQEIKRIAAIEAPPVSDAVPAKVWRIAFDTLRTLE